MKKVLILFLLYNIHIVFTSNASLSQPLCNRLTCRVHIQPLDPDEIHPSPEEISSFDNLLKIVKKALNNAENDVKFSSINFKQKKTVRVTIIRHDGTPIIISYSLPNNSEIPNFENYSIWDLQEDTKEMPHLISGILDNSIQTYFSDQELNRLRKILNGQTTDTFDTHESEEPDIIVAPQRRPRSKEQESLGSTIPPLGQYPRTISPPAFSSDKESSPEPSNPNVSE